MRRVRILLPLPSSPCALAARRPRSARAPPRTRSSAPRRSPRRTAKASGRAEPSKIFNGGDPSGSVSKIKWSGWGNPSAIGYGLNPIFKPGGGYFRKPARIELRATDLGKCGNQAAYTRLEVRVPKHPGGKLGKWFSGPGAKTICKPPY